jgi:hypothetical protein
VLAWWDGAAQRLGRGGRAHRSAGHIGVPRLLPLPGALNRQVCCAIAHR